MAEPESLNTMFQNSFVKLGDGSYALQTSGGAVAPNSVDTAAIQNGAVTSEKIADGTIAVIDLSATVEARLLDVQAPAQVNSTATDVAGIVADFNALLAKLRTAGVIDT